ncbi:hypothetical protein Pint_33465 [Pistacia integerrima]|uniref:Uncharacterized protein n=1 Tax=Pistacia integerrima TaxID=434235 RepID=A0ACC0X7L9_9ROSI|nr:hypothetical protein Pint_33465 [Pistacia integerrima]
MQNSKICTLPFAATIHDLLQSSPPLRVLHSRSQKQCQISFKLSAKLQCLTSSLFSLQVLVAVLYSLRFILQLPVF